MSILSPWHDTITRKTKSMPAGRNGWLLKPKYSAKWIYGGIGCTKGGFRLHSYQAVRFRSVTMVTFTQVYSSCPAMTFYSTKLGVLSLGRCVAIHIRPR